MAGRIIVSMDTKLLRNLRGTAWDSYEVDDPEYRLFALTPSAWDTLWTRLNDLARAGKEVRVRIRVRDVEKW